MALRQNDLLYEFIKSHAQLVRFALVGGLCTVLNLVVLWVFTTWMGIHYLIAVIIAFFSINVISFFLNKWFTFKTLDTNVSVEMTRYYSTMLASLLLNLALMHVLVDWMYLHYLLASICLTLLFFAFNFIVHKSWSFREEARKNYDYNDAKSGG